MELDILKDKKVAELREIAKALGIKGASGMKKQEIVDLLTRMHEEAEKEKAAAAEKEAKKAAPKTKRTAKKNAEPASEPAAGKPEKAAKRAAKPKKAQPAAAELKEEPADPQLKVYIPEPASAYTSEENAISAVPDNKPAEPAAEPASLPEKTEESKPEEIKSEESDPKKGAPLKEGRVEKTGILDIAEGGFGFLRFDNFLTSDEDVYVSPTQIRRFNLKTGDKICGIARKPGSDERFGALLYVKTVNDDEPGVSIRRRDFSDLTPIYPTERIRLENGSSALSMRLPVSMSAVASMVMDPPSSIFLAAPKNFFGLYSAAGSRPPDSVRPLGVSTRLYARAKRVMESIRIITSLPCSTSRCARASTISATFTWWEGCSSKVE